MTWVKWLTCVGVDDVGNDNDTYELDDVDDVNDVDDVDNLSEDG